MRDSRTYGHYFNGYYTPFKTIAESDEELCEHLRKKFPHVVNVGNTLDATQLRLIFNNAVEKFGLPYARIYRDATSPTPMVAVVDNGDALWDFYARKFYFADKDTAILFKLEEVGAHQ